jgi:hypothetical protein
MRKFTSISFLVTAVLLNGAFVSAGKMNRSHTVLPSLPDRVKSEVVHHMDSKDSFQPFPSVLLF